MSDEKDEGQEYLEGKFGPDWNKDSEGVLLPGVWPGTVCVEGVAGESVMTVAQERRASALYSARSVLEKRGATPLTGKDSSIPPSVADLIRVAKWIITGEGS